MIACSSVWILLLCVCSVSLCCDAGFSGGFAKKKPPTNKKSKKKIFREQKPIRSLDADAATLKTVQLGGGNSVDIYVPPNRLEDGIVVEGGNVKIDDPKQFVEDFYGSGDVIWPSSLHLARLVANCPSFVANKRVIDIGCGLGLASAAAHLAKPTSIAVSDLDDGVMDLAMRTLENMNKNNNVPLDKCRIDWLKKETWPVAKSGSSSCIFDVVLASDVLFNKDSIQHFAELVAHCLLMPPSTSNDDQEDASSSSRALIVDPANRPHRDLFVKCCQKAGLVAVPTPFPGQEKDFVLINVLPSDEV